MSNTAAMKNEFDGGHQLSNNSANNHALNIYVCVDASPASTKIIPHASAIADALSGQLSLVHMVEPDGLHAPYDPVEWGIRKRQASLYLARLAKRYETGSNPIDFKVLESISAEQISECTAGKAGHIAVFCRGSEDAGHRIGDVARRIMENVPGSLLLVPSTVREADTAQYDRILVPLDGSSRAESALPFAVKIAQRQNAEIVLVHAMPKFDIIRAGPHNVQDMELQERISQRSKRQAREYIERTRETLSDCGVAVRCLLLESGDVRRHIEDAIVSQAADLIVMSSHGQSGYSDVPAGDVSSFILRRAPVPVLMVRRPRTSETDHYYSAPEAKGVRRPRGTSG